MCYRLGERGDTGMTDKTIPVRIRVRTRDDISFLRRELSATYGRDYSISDVIDALMHGYSPGNPKLAGYLRDVVNRRPDTIGEIQ
jgi:hypothetical protein